MDNFETSEVREVQHGELGIKFVGLSRYISKKDAPELIQFNGIKYGNIPARFMQATLNESFPDVYDARNYGPKCPQVVLPVGLEDALIGAPAKNAENIFDEFECLNLNIITPDEAHGGSFYPVMLYIHGGGGNYGSNSEWFCDGGPLVSMSQQVETPVVHVAINYRLGVFGQVGSTELQAANGNLNGGNFAYHDMHLAIEWVYKHIIPFGGNPEDITIYGESFGSIGVETLLHSALPQRFSRCILQSEVIDAPLFGNPESWATKDAVFQKLKDNLSVETVKELQEVPTQALIDAWTVSEPRAGGMPCVPMIDDVILSQDWRDVHNLPRDGPVKVMIGNTSAEGTVVRLLTGAAPKITPPSTSVLIDALGSAIDKVKLEPLLEAYQIIESPDLTPSLLKTNLIHLIEDIIWHLPTSKTISRINNTNTTNNNTSPNQDPINSQNQVQPPKTPSNIYRYTFNHPNPFPGPYHGTAAHALDLAYLHGEPQIFNSTANPEAEKALAALIQKRWIRFANGEEPWAREKVLQIGPGPGPGPGPGAVQEVSVEEYLGGEGRGERLRVLDGLGFGEQEGLVGVALGFVAQFSSVE